MMNEEQLKFLERLIVQEQATGAAHKRIDRIESLLQDDLQELKEVVAWMNRAKGWAGASFLAASALGALFVIVMEKIIR